MLPALLLAAALTASDSTCWDLAYAAVRKRAAAAHPPFIQYDAIGTVTEDGVVFDRVRQAIAYRADDGSAFVEDDRFALPYAVSSVDPGPPELGPYGERRLSWLPDELDPGLHEIAKVRAAHQATCRNKGIARYAGRDVYDLAFASPTLRKAGLQELWVDAQSNDIWKLVYRANDMVPVDYTVELMQAGRYLVVRHITYRFEFKVDDQSSDVLGEYYYDDFRFPSAPPAFATHGAV